MAPSISRTRLPGFHELVRTNPGYNPRLVNRLRRLERDSSPRGTATLLVDPLSEDATSWAYSHFIRQVEGHLHTSKETVFILSPERRSHDIRVWLKHVRPAGKVILVNTPEGAVKEEKPWEGFAQTLKALNIVRLQILGYDRFPTDRLVRTAHEALRRHIPCTVNDSLIISTCDDSIASANRSKRSYLQRRAQRLERVRTEFRLADNSIGLRYWGHAKLTFPRVFQDMGFDQVSLLLMLRYGRRSRGDILDVYDGLSLDTPFEMHRAVRRVRNVHTLAQALEDFKDNGVDNLWIQVTRNMTSESITLYSPECPDLIANYR